MTARFFDHNGQRMPAPDHGYENLIVLRKPSTPAEVWAKVEACYAGFGTRILRQKTLQFVPSAACNRNAADYTRSAFRYYDYSMRYNSAAADMYEHYEEKNSTETYMCAGTTTCYVLSGRHGVADALRACADDLCRLFPHEYSSTCC